MNTNKEMNTKMNEDRKLKYISDVTLDKSLKSLVSKEREVLTSILQHIEEVDRRKLYLKMAYPSLFDYLTKHIGYANGSAQRRIDAARLNREVPDVISSIQAGKVNLAQIALMQKAIRQVQIETKNTVTSALKQKLFTDIKEKSIIESEILINKSLDIQIKESTRVAYQQNEAVRVEITFSKEQWDKIVRLREILSNSLPHGSWDQVFEYLADKVIEQKDFAKTKVARDKLYKNKNVNAENAANVKAAEEKTTNEKTRVDLAIKSERKTSTQRKSIPKAIQKEIFGRDICCQYKDSVTGKVCSSKWRLNIDHIKPVWAGGLNDKTNLRILCANHNRELYRSQSFARPC